MKTKSRGRSSYDRIYDAVRRIPKGRVATYGQVAVLAGIPRQPRQVGYALAALPDYEKAPWHRVVNAKGEISRRADPDFEWHQRMRLEHEGVIFDLAGRIDLTQFGWQPKEKRKTTK